jgi:hypothetical protein
MIIVDAVTGKVKKTDVDNEAEAAPIVCDANWFNDEHKAINESYYNTILRAKALGEALIAKKAELGHGNWLPWLKENLSFSPDTATNYMTLAEGWTRLSNSEHVRNLSIRQALKEIKEGEPKTRKEKQLNQKPVADSNAETIETVVVESSLDAPPPIGVEVRDDNLVVHPVIPEPQPEEEVEAWEDDLLWYGEVEKRKDVLPQVYYPHCRLEEDGSVTFPLTISAAQARFIRLFREYDCPDSYKECWYYKSSTYEEFVKGCFSCLHNSDAEALFSHLARGVKASDHFTLAEMKELEIDWYWDGDDDEDVCDEYEFNDDERMLYENWSEGDTIVVNQRKGKHENLIRWAKDKGILEYIDRKKRDGKVSKFGNPFEMTKESERNTVIEQFKKHFYSNHELMKEAEKLRGKVLACWCHPKPCHGDVIVDYLHPSEDEDGELHSVEKAQPIVIGQSNVKIYDKYTGYPANEFAALIGKSGEYISKLSKSKTTDRLDAILEAEGWFYDREKDRFFPVANAS